MNINTGSASYIQADRILRIETSLGLDVFLPERMTMVEKVSDLFELSIAVRSKKTDIKPDDLVGKLVDVSVEQGMGERRTWNGLVIELMEGPPVTRGLRSYHLTIVPEHWLLTQKSDCRIWLNKTSVEVAEILMQEHKLLGPNTFGIVNKYTPKPQHYSVQFNETDWDYLNRRLEEDGIFYWFHHEGGEIGEVSATHRLHIASHQFGYQENDYQDIRYAMGSTDRNHISKFEKRFRFIPSSRTGRDWNFENPGSAQEASTPSLHKMPHSEGYELYEYPFIGGYGTGEKASEGIEYTQLEKQSRFRMMAAEVDHERIEGQSTVRTFSPGHRFKPYDVANPDNEFEEHAIIEIHHQAEDRSYETNEGDPDYTNTFVALPSRVPATPHRQDEAPKDRRPTDSHHCRP